MTEAGGTGAETARENLRLAHARWVLGLLPGEELPELATSALQAGLDGPALRQLAGLAGPTRAEAGALFERALVELGCTALTAHAAAGIIARHWARRIVDQEVTPYRGAKAIWFEVCEPRGDACEWFVFKSLASEHEDYRFARGDASEGLFDDALLRCEERIVAQARVTLDG